MTNKKIKKTFKKIEIPIYEVILFVSFSQSDDEIMKDLSKYPFDFENWRSQIEDNSYNGRCLMQYEIGVFLIRMKDFKNINDFMGVLIHEIFHIVVGILDRAGASLTDSSEEAYAYLIGYITKEIMEYV